MLTNMRLGGEVIFLVEQQGRFVFQIIPFLDTTVTDGENMLTSSSSMLTVQVGCVFAMFSALVLITLQSIGATCRQLILTTYAH